MLGSSLDNRVGEFARSLRAFVMVKPKP